MTTLQDILKREQRIGDNLSSHQMFVVLDGLLLRALEPMADTSPTFLEAVAEILAHRLIHRKRMGPEVCSACFAAFFTDPQTACRDLMKSNPDRGFLFVYLDRVCEVGERLIASHVHVVKYRHSRIKRSYLQDLSDATRVLGRDRRLIPAIRTTSYWYGEAIDFRDQIAEKYIRLIYQTSLREHRKAAKRLELSDLFDTGYLTALRAVERFNSNNGVLTSYMALWLKCISYSPTVQSIGLSFNSRSKDPDDVGWSVPLDDDLQVMDHTIPHPDSREDGSALIKKVSAIAHDPDVRAALAVSGIVPPGATSLQSK